MPRLSRILGPDGEPVDLDDLFGPPRAGPTLTGVRQPISGHPAEGLTPARLANIHRAAAEGDPLGYFELAEDIEERDPHYLSVLGTRRRQVAQLPVTIEAASDDADHVRHADLLRDWLKEGVLDLALFDVLDAIGKGLSITEIEWETNPELIAPKALHYRPQRWFTFDPADGDTVVLQEGVTREPLAPHRFILHRHPSKSGLTVRSGLARVASWCWMFKAFTTRDWQVFVQNYGSPVRVGRYDRNATNEDKAVLWRAVANIAGDCAAIIPKEMEIEFVSLKEAAKTGKLYEERCDWLDRQISKAVLGQTTTTDAVSGGHAVAQEHRLVQEDIERADAKLLSASLTRQIVQPIIAFNFGPQKKYPRMVIGRPDETPLELVVEAIYKLGPLGLEVEASEVRDRLGFSEPDKTKTDVAIIGGRAPPKVADDPAKTPALPPPPSAKMLDRVRHFVSIHASAPEPEFVDRLTARVAEDAAGALAGMTDTIRNAFDAATDMHDLARRLDALDLDDAAFAEAMQRGMALSYLVGQAALLDELEREPR